MKHGKALEAFAKKEYKKVMKKTHKKFSSINTGLQISADKPFLAASVDLETSCKCCGEGLCEIKCPETIKDQKPTHENVKYIKENDGIVSLCENHQYFFQIQGQMAISKRDHCDFFVFTYHGSLCIRVPFSAEFWATMEDKLTWFWMEHVLSKTEKGSENTIYLCGTCGDECVDIPEHSDDQSVGCDKCGVWVHYRCAGVTDESVQDIDRWICAKCQV
ncbi:uncharacterized protein LOC128216184 [Mya arenaria]|uniref:uncharacterized protein LOC128216184 n=1 Tax=Mya arenaria TaxID=6604 RepID=UPI0022E46BE9|nr:uncharacterized protein LOC128216184 [Mya arenaria]